MLTVGVLICRRVALSMAITIAMQASIFLRDLPLESRHPFSVIRCADDNT